MDDNNKSPRKSNLEVLRDSMQLASAGLTLVGEVLDAGEKFTETYVNVFGKDIGIDPEHKSQGNNQSKSASGMDILSDSLQMASAGLTLAGEVLNAGGKFVDALSNVTGKGEKNPSKHTEKNNKKVSEKSNLEVLRDYLQLASAGLNLTGKVLDAGEKFAHIFANTMETNFTRNVDEMVNPIIYRRVSEGR